MPLEALESLRFFQAQAPPAILGHVLGPATLDGSSRSTIGIIERMDNAFLYLPRLFHDSRRLNAARAIVRCSIYTWVKHRQKVHCEAQYIDHGVHGDAFMECFIDGIDTDMATNTRQFQSHLQNKLTAVVRNDWRKHVWFRAALKFKWDFKARLAADPTRGDPRIPAHC